jgi:hypothetical protein
MERTTFTYGGQGGGPFSPRNPQSVGLRSGSLVDAIIINGEQFGESGGSNPTIATLNGDDYWSEFTVRAGEYVDHLTLVSKNGRKVDGGGDGGDQAHQSGLRIISIAGRSGLYLDQISLDVVLGYQASTVTAANVEFVLDMETSGQVIKHYSMESVKTAHSYQLVSQQAHEWSMNASAEGEYYAKFSVSTGYKMSDSRTETISDESSQAVETGSSTEQTIGTNEAAFLIGRADILKDSDGHAWMAPTSGSNWVVLPKDRFHELAGKYDLTGGTCTQTGLRAVKDSTGFYKLEA